MRDRADPLRELAPMSGVRPGSVTGEAAVIVIGSGKGGVGKSVLSVLFAATLARLGHRVLLVDGSQSQGDLHILLGVRPPSGLRALLAGEVSPHALLVSVCEGLWLMPVGSGTEALHALSPTDRARLHLRLTAVYQDFDVVIVDAGPGIESVIRSTMKAGRLVVVSVPEPAALSDAYALIKIVTLQIPSLPIDVLINQARDHEEGGLAFARLELASQRFLRRSIGSLGFVREHPTLRLAVRAPGALLRQVPEEVVSIASRLVAAPRSEPASSSGRECAPSRGDGS